MDTTPDTIEPEARARVLSALDRVADRTRAGRALPSAIATTTWAGSPFIAETHTAEDVYSLLGNLPALLMFPEDVGSVTVTTTGWAAPLPEDGVPLGRPSDHPDAVRVTLALTVDARLAGAGLVVSALRFSDGRADVLENTGTGALGDAMLEAWRAIDEAGLDARGVR